MNAPALTIPPILTSRPSGMIPPRHFWEAIAIPGYQVRSPIREMPMPSAPPPPWGNRLECR